MKRAIQDKRLADAERYAHAMPLSLTSDRKKMLTSLAKAYQNSGNARASLSALSGISNSSAKSDEIADIVSQFLRADKAAEAEHAVKAMTEMGKQATSWIEIAKFYHKKGYNTRAKQAITNANISTSKMQDGERKLDRYAALTKLYADIGMIEQAAKTVMKAQGSKRRPDAMVAIIKYLSEKHSAAQAEGFLEPLQQHEEHYMQARALVARAHAREKSPDKAESILSRLKADGATVAAIGARKSMAEAWSALAKFYVGEGMTDKADQAIKKISLSDIKAKTFIYYGGKMADRGKVDLATKYYTEALTRIRSLKNKERRDALLVEWAISQATYGDKNVAQSVLKDISSSQGLSLIHI